MSGYNTLNLFSSADDQLTFACSKLTVETLEKGLKHVSDVNDVVLVFLLLTLNIFHTFF